MVLISCQINGDHTGLRIHYAATHAWYHVFTQSDRIQRQHTPSLSPSGVVHSGYMRLPSWTLRYVDDVCGELLSREICTEISMRYAGL